FETLYETMNRSVSRYGEIGFTIMELGLTARVEKVKPNLVRRPLQSKEPNADASKGTRPMYYNREWHEAQIWEMDYLLPGNVLEVRLLLNIQLQLWLSLKEIMFISTNGPSYIMSMAKNHKILTNRIQF